MTKRLLARTLLVPLLLMQTACFGTVIQTTAAGLSIGKSLIELSYGQNPLTTGVDRKRIACKGFETGTYSYVRGHPEKSDTDKTIRWIRGHNAAYRELNCPKK